MKITKKHIDFSSGKAVSLTILLPIVLNKYISGSENEIFIRETINHKNIYSIYINKIGDRASHIHCVGRAKALSVIEIAKKYGINLNN